MGNPLIIDLFVEDRAQEDFIKALVNRLAKENHIEADIRIRSARGGHGRALSELGLYQKSIIKGILPIPDALVVAIDSNCQRYMKAQSVIQNSLDERFSGNTVIACPEPHIERWYLADKISFSQVIGFFPRLSRRKCEKDYYKNILSQSVIDAGHIPTLGGIEFAQELVAAMDLYRAGKEEKSLKVFIDNLNTFLKRGQ